MQKNAGTVLFARKKGSKVRQMLNSLHSEQIKTSERTGKRTGRMTAPDCNSEKEVRRIISDRERERERTTLDQVQIDLALETSINKDLPESRTEEGVACNSSDYHRSEEKRSPA